jgi:hypothetical protein
MPSPSPADAELEEERKAARDEVTQLKAKILTARRQSQDVQRVSGLKLARCEEALTAARAELSTGAPRGVVVATADPAVPADVSAAHDANLDVADKAGPDTTHSLQLGPFTSQLFYSCGLVLEIAPRDPT